MIKLLARAALSFEGPTDKSQQALVGGAPVDAATQENLNLARFRPSVRWRTDRAGEHA